MDKKTSILINGQLPEFVRDEYPLFGTFLEAYYEFLENKQGTNKNDLTFQAKKLKEEQSRQLLNVQSFYNVVSKARNINQINTGLGINTQRGPQTGAPFQNMGWSPNK